MGLYAQILRTSGGPTAPGSTQVYGQMSVCIFDDTTNLPANGNNCIVTYQQNINGVTNQYDVIVPGLSTPIYTGELSDSNPNSLYTTSFQVLSLVLGATPVPAVADDLKIVSVITTPTSAIGSSDGTVNINATSSFPAIQYSLDNVTWQTSSLFTGRPGGKGTAYVKDANSGTAQVTYTVSFVGKVLVSDPSVNLGNGNISRWNAAFNPIPFTFQRQDFQVTSVVLGANNNIQVAVNADLTNVTARTSYTQVTQFTAFTTITSPGDLVYINTTYYQGTYEVVAKDSGTLTLNCPYTQADTLGFININSLKPSYQLQMQLTYVDPSTGNFTTTLLKYTPRNDGSLKADLSNFLQGLLQAKDASNYTQTNFRDLNLSASYTVKYAEVWTGGIVTWVSLSNPFYVVFAAKQLGTLGAGNLQQYIPFPLGFQPAKWMTDFATPVYSPGFPFDLGFIFSEYLSTLSPFYNIQLLDINQNPIQPNGLLNAFLQNQDGGYQLNQDSSKFIIASQQISSVPIVQNLGLNRLLINIGVPDICYYFRVQLQYTSGGNTYNLTQSQLVRVNQDAQDQSVYLRWIGLSGSWEYYRFVYNQAVTLDVTSPQIVKNYVLDWQNGDTIEDVISKTAGEKMQVFAENVSVDEIKGLQPIKYSPKVQMLLSVGPPPQWVTVVVASGSYAEYETFLGQYSFSLVFALPSKNIQSQ